MASSCNRGCRDFCIVALVGSRSSSGFIALAIGAVILALVLLSRKKKLFAAGIVVVVIGVIAAGVLANTTGIGQTLKKTVVGTYHMKDQFSLNDIKTNTDDVELDIWNNPLYVSYDLGSDGVITVVCKDADGQEIQTTEVDQENHILALNDERFANIQIQPIMFTDNTAGIKMIIDGVEWDFSKMIRTDMNISILQENW